MAKPIVVRAGGVKVKVYHRRQRKASGIYDSWIVADWTTGKRRLLTFGSEEAARSEAQSLAIRLANGEAGVASLTSADRAAYNRAIEALKPLGLPVDLAVLEYAEAKRRLGSRSLGEAVSYFVTRNPVDLPRIPVSEAVSKMIAAKERDGASEVHLRDLRMRLGKFAAAFACDLSSADPAKVNLWLREHWEGRSRNNYRTAAVNLFRWAEAEGLLPRGHFDASRVAVAREEETAIEIFKPEEMARLLRAVQLDPEALPAGFNRRHASRTGLLATLLLGGFAGMRTAEIQRQRWEDVNVERGFIRVTAGKGGTAARRLIPISDNLRAWLSVCGRDGEVCCDYPRPWDALARVALRAGLEWKHNALRHSFASYRTALVQNIAQVALECGNSPRMILQHYREVVSEAEAKAWFGIMPDRPANIINLAVA